MWYNVLDHIDLLLISYYAHTMLVSSMYAQLDPNLYDIKYNGSTYGFHNVQ